MANLAAFFWLVCTLFFHAASAQTVVPSNSSLPATTNGSTPLPQLQLLIQLGQQQTGMKTAYDIVPARDPAAPDASLNATYLGQLDLTGNIVLTNTSNFNSLAQKDLAYISCDPSAYSGGNIAISEVLSTAASKVMTTANQGGIILYSTNSSSCNLTDDASFPFQNVFTFTESRWAEDLLDRLSRLGEPVAVGTVTTNQTMPTNSSGGASNGQNTTDVAGPSPTTTVAMIILYSITGLITVCFLFIIITGAVRAHRHPERYRPRHVPGISGPQSRARGIARAMLDSLPIVKFGEREPDKPDATEDGVELENGVGDPTGVESGEHPEHTREATEAPVPPSTRATANEGMPTDGERDSSTQESTAVKIPEGQADAGLACSVCTDDFVKGQDTRVLPCKHKFHPECIDPWLLNVSGTCPLCRTDLRPPDSSPPAETSAPAPTARTSLVAAAGVPVYVATGTNNVYHRTDRRSIGLSTYLHRALNSRHMRDATPQQRLEALRDLRNSRRDGGRVENAESARSTSQNGSQNGSGTGVDGASAGRSDDRAASPAIGESARARVGQRLSRLLGRQQSSRGGDVETGRQSAASGERDASGERQSETQPVPRTETIPQAQTPAPRTEVNQKAIAREEEAAAAAADASAMQGETVPEAPAESHAESRLDSQPEPQSESPVEAQEDPQPEPQPNVRKTPELDTTDRDHAKLESEGQSQTQDR